MTYLERLKARLLAPDAKEGLTFIHVDDLRRLLHVVGVLETLARVDDDGAIDEEGEIAFYSADGAVYGARKALLLDTDAELDDALAGVKRPVKVPCQAEDMGGWPCGDESSLQSKTEPRKYYCRRHKTSRQVWDANELEPMPR